MTGPGNDGIPQHAATPSPIWESGPVRTAIQGVATDVGVAVAFIVYDAMNSDDVDWRLLGITVGKTVLMTAASWVMKRYKPRSTGDTAAA